jgi:hypothetical protein
MDKRFRLQIKHPMKGAGDDDSASLSSSRQLLRKTYHNCGSTLIEIAGAHERLSQEYDKYYCSYSPTGSALNRIISRLSLSESGHVREAPSPVYRNVPVTLKYYRYASTVKSKSWYTFTGTTLPPWWPPFPVKSRHTNHRCLHLPQCVLQHLGTVLLFVYSHRTHLL